MPNHYHLQIATPRLNLSEAIRWNISYAIWFNRTTRRKGPLLEGRFKAVVHEPRQSGWIIHEYIHLNPVRVKRLGTSRSDHEGPSLEQIAARVTELREFKWSSYRAYAGYASVPRWLSTEEILPSAPGRAPGAKREQYRTRFTEMIGAGNLGTAWKEQLAGGLVLGGNDFVAKVRKLLKGDRTKQKSIRTLENPPVDWATIVAAIENYGANLGKISGSAAVILAGV